MVKKTLVPRCIKHNVFVYYSASQISVVQMSYHPRHGHYFRVQEADGSIQVCLQLQIDGIVREPIYVHVETTLSTAYLPAIGKLYEILTIIYIV